MAFQLVVSPCAESFPLTPCVDVSGRVDRLVRRPDHTCVIASSHYLTRAASLVFNEVWFGCCQNNSYWSSRTSLITADEYLLHPIDGTRTQNMKEVMSWCKQLSYPDRLHAKKLHKYLTCFLGAHNMENENRGASMKKLTFTTCPFPMLSMKGKEWIWPLPKLNKCIIDYLESIIEIELKPKLMNHCTPSDWTNSILTLV